MTLQVGQLTQTREGLGFGFARRLILSNADVLALPNTVPILVPAIEDRAIVPLWYSFVFNPWVADYTVDGTMTMLADLPSGIYASLGYEPDASLLRTFFAPGAAAMDLVFPIAELFDDIASFWTDFVDQPLGLVTTNGVMNPNFTGGDPGNQITITTYYLTIP